MFKVGCCGFPSGMRSYFNYFPVSELQSSFYKPLGPDKAKKWRKMAPEAFEFTVKAWQLITHKPTSPTYKKGRITIPDGKKGRYGAFQPTEEVFAAWETTRELCGILGSKLVLFQCPGSFRPTEKNLANMKEFFASANREGPTGRLVFVWEPRGKAWTREIVGELCEELELIHCCDPFATLPAHDAEVVYFRLHGSPPGKRMYQYYYSEEDLERLEAWCTILGHKEVYVLFNNHGMLTDGIAFKKRMGLEWSGGTLGKMFK